MYMCACMYVQCMCVGIHVCMYVCVHTHMCKWGMNSTVDVWRSEGNLWELVLSPQCAGQVLWVLSFGSKLLYQLRHPTSSRPTPLKELFRTPS